MPTDDELRAAALAYVGSRVERSGGYVTRQALEAFTFLGERIPLISRQQGIWKPKQLDAALSIMTAYASSPDLRHYADDDGPDGYHRYKWRGTDPDFWDNRALRRAMVERRKLIWFTGVAPGVFTVTMPVWLVHEEPDQHQFVVAADELLGERWEPRLATAPMTDPVRRYAEVLRKQRLHQKVFSPRVLAAYDSQCAVCRLRHLLDAAHIKEDSAGGLPIVPNGLALCAIHHRAFDARVLGIRPDYRLEIRADILAEHDGPTLQHALQEMHGAVLTLPRRRVDHPSPELLEERYERFRSTA